MYWKAAALVGLGLAIGTLVAPNIEVRVRPGGAVRPTAAQGAGLQVTTGRYSGADEPVARAVRQAAPAVVNIDTVARVHVRDFFYGDRVERRAGAGSGVIIDRSGHVLTNQHVVAGANQIAVTLQDGRRLPARVIGSDRMTDIALLKVDGANLPAAVIGRSADLVVGQTVIAIGNPVGLRFSASEGIVSALGRPIEFDERVYEDLIQTDAPINPGNSGGALINLAGQVVGVNTLVRAGAQGIGFAIPIDTAMHIAERLRRDGRVPRPWPGFVAEEFQLPPQAAQSYGLPAPRGVVVAGVYRGTPAAELGLSRGDILLEAADRPVRNLAEWRAALATRQIGQTLPIVVWREGERFRADIRLVEAP